MAEPNSDPNPKDPKNPDPKNPDPNPTPKPVEVDLSKLSDEQLAKVLEDPRIWKTARLSELREDSKAYKALKAKQDKEAEDKAKEQGEYKTLLEKKEAELTAANQKIADQARLSKINAAAIAKGMKDLDAVAKLIDMTKVTIDETTGEVKGVDEAIESLSKERPYLLTGKPAIGAPSNPSDPAAPLTTFTMSQLQDSKFYQEHRDEIQKAQMTPGGIIEDRPGFTAQPK